jgi:protein-arginine deiminase
MRLSVFVLLSGFVAVGCGASDGENPAPGPAEKTSTVVLRADTNRDGVIDENDDADKTAFTAARGAIFLANIDDDLVACPKTGKDIALAACNDAANDTVDGDDDLLDMAPLRTVPWPDAPADATATISASTDEVRIFRKTDAGWVMQPNDASVGAAEIAAGMELAIEAKDIVRDPAVWDGNVDVTFHVTGEGVDASDVVRLHVAPVLLQHHGQKVERLFATKVGDPGNTAFRADLTKAFPKLESISVPEGDQWTQDFFEAGYMSMPAPASGGGGQHVVRVVLRSANAGDRDSLRAGGRVVFTLFRGKDVAGVQQFDPKADLDMDSLNSFGNTETIPPFTFAGQSWPLGRIIRGSTESYHPDASLARLLDAQQLQKPLLVDTSWLLVSHIDETVSFLPKTDGFTLLANDPRLAKTMLEDLVSKGHGDALMFEGEKVIDDMDAEIPAQRSISAVLADADVMAQSQAAAAAIDGQIATIEEATGLVDGDIVRVPFLHEKVYGASIAYQPGTVNGVLLDPTHFVSPAPHGPMIDGKDPFETQLETALGEKGVTVSWVEDWDLYHRLEGEVHCGSNVFREIPTTPWWEVAK